MALDVTSKCEGLILEYCNTSRVLAQGRFKTKEVCSVQSSIEPAASESALATVTIRSGVADLL